MSMRCKGNHANAINRNGRLASEVDEEFGGKKKPLEIIARRRMVGESKDRMPKKREVV